MTTKTTLDTVLVPTLFKVKMWTHNNYSKVYKYHNEHSAIYTEIDTHNHYYDQHSNITSSTCLFIYFNFKNNHLCYAYRIIYV